jgi:chromosome segregation ATPase
MHTLHWCLLIAVALIATSCGKKDNSADTDQASQALRKAQADVSKGSNELVKNQDEIEQQKRDLVREQQQLADKQQLAERQRQDLGSAQGTLQEARLAYAAAVKARFAKLDASLATLATKTDAKSKDAVTGLRARRDQLLVKLDAMAGASDPTWNEYTKDVDTTFDAIETDLLK